MIWFKFGILLVFVSVVSSAKLPDYIKPCSLSDPKLDDCVLKHAIDAIPSLAQGDPKYNIPSLKPLHIDEVTLGGSQSLNLTLKNADVSGIAKAEIEKLTLKHNDTNYHLSAHAKIPKLKVKGEYIINGRILILPITGNGPADIVLDNLVFDVNYYLGTEERKSKKYLKVINDDIDIKISHASFKFDNLFNGDKRLSDEMHKFLASNWQEIFNELRPAIIEVIKTVLLSIVNGITHKVPVDEFFAK